MRVATPAGHRAPWVSNFCETNVRTYVRDGEGRSGIWFFSLDAARLGAVVTARATPYRLPYFWSSMRLGVRGTRVAYRSWRRWPGPLPAASRVRIMSPAGVKGPGTACGPGPRPCTSPGQHAPRAAGPNNPRSQ